MPPTCSRRHLLSVLASGCLAACAPEPEAPLRVAAHPWPGYELMYLARARFYFDEAQVRLIEMPSATASLRALATGALDGAALTLDEVLSARARGVDLVVVAVLDVSRGADVVLARPGLTRPQDLAGRRIGAEASATGAVMLDALLRHSGLALHQVKVRQMPVDEHLQAYREGKVDALVTYEPVKSALLSLGAVPLFSSADVPGLIVDTLALRRDRLATHPRGLKALLAGHFKALGDWNTSHEACAEQLAPRLRLTPAAVPAAFAELDLPDLAANRAWLSGGQARLLRSATRLQAAMVAAGLLESPGSLDLLAEDAYLPGS